YVSEIKISGVRCFSGPREVDLRLTRPDGSHAGWTVLAGRNGSGKTTLLRAIALAMAGPTVAHSLIADFADWVAEGVDEGVVEAKLTVDAEWDRFTETPSAAGFLRTCLKWLREPVE